MMLIAKRFKTMSELRQPLALLVQHHWLTRVQEGPEKRVGRPPSPLYRVNGGDLGIF